MTTRTWYLVRHGETEWNAAQRMQGQLDSRLTPAGHEHARGSGRLLARLGVDAMFASPLGRVRETLGFIDEHVSLAPTFDDRLMEWSSGQWSGELYADLKARWPVEFAAWEADRYAYRSPGGENFIDLVERGQAFLAEAARSPAPRIAIVAHGFMNRALAGVLLSLPPDAMMRIRQTNDTVIRVTTDAGGSRADHFIGGEGPHDGLPEGVKRARESA